MSKPIHLREADFKREVEKYTYPKALRDEFFEYWTEPNKSGTKMRFEMEKTWHLGRRLARWANCGFNKNWQGQKPDVKPKIVKEPVTDIEKLDALLAQYKSKFESVTHEQFAAWYEYMKREKLLRPFSKDDIEFIKVAYPGDNMKCRAACVKMTFDGFINSGLTFGHIMELREKLNGALDRS